MRTEPVSKLLCELAEAIGKTLVAFFKTMLYRIWRYESESDREERIRAMQALLDAEHGWA